MERRVFAEVEAAMKMRNGFSICRVPPDIKQGNEKYYEPGKVAIGPYHRGKKQLQAMEAYKNRYLNYFLRRNTNKTLREYIHMLGEVEDQARSYYFDHFDLTSEEFVRMLLLDGCFIIEFFLRYGLRGEDGNEIPDVKWFSRRILTDLFLLENQIPFFVINMLFKHLLCDIQTTSEVLRQRYALGLPHIIGAGSYFLEEYINMVNIEDARHMICLLYNIYARQNDYGAERNADNIHAQQPSGIQSASKLVEYGIKFRRSNRRYIYSPMGISCEDGVIEIPPIEICEEVKYLMLNILAFEQSNLTIRQDLSRYFQFMDFLIDTPKDVEILVEAGIISNYLKNNEDAALFFNQLNDYGNFRDRDRNLCRVYAEINEFCNSKWHKYKVKLKQDYFSNPWSIILLIAAVVLLILTLVQTYFAWYGYINPPSS